ncbi:ABC transporter permease DevC [Sediminicoccus sp. KRV36]|uniref:ABC transporter permease DevC n=1 Tax=Sediminicoccus sp. KRV36 TaxID=3133721 RepID=UPI0020103AFC|nr:ABC transporter permease DevC [Sediminicoccus rosea]UPY37173.1 ABC transporter permease DevC [Sediminicoccus rosea]
MNQISAAEKFLPWAPELTGEAPPPPSPPKPRPGLTGFFLLPLRLAWRQLRAEKSRLAAAMAGVMFACVLVFMQLGFRGALFDSATNMLGAMRADLFLMHPMTDASFRPEPLPRARAFQTLADPDVAVAVPIYLAQTAFRNPETGRKRAVQLIGLDAEIGAVAFTGLAPLVDALKRPDTIAFDVRSRPEFGPIGPLFAERGPFQVQLGNREMELVGLVEIGPSFGADGNVVLSETNFRRVFERRVSNTDLVALKLRDGADVRQVQARLRGMLPGDVVVLTHAELVAHERSYWENGTPIGFIFVFGSLMGLVVGMVIVYQILFSDIASHISEYATLKAMGYSNGYLSRVVMSEAFILAIIGFIPGLLLSTWLYNWVGAATFLPLAMYPERGVTVFLMIFTMCALAGLLAMRKLRDANPADMF